MKELLLYVAKQLVDQPDAVTVTQREFRETVQTAMAYYYKHFSGYQWSDEDREKFEQTGNAKYKVKSRVDKLDKIIKDYINDIQLKYQESAN